MTNQNKKIEEIKKALKDCDVEIESITEKTELVYFIDIMDRNRIQEKYLNKIISIINYEF